MYFPTVVDPPVTVGKFILLRLRVESQQYVTESVTVANRNSNRMQRNP